MSFDETITTSIVYDAIRQSGVIDSQSLYQALQARTKKQQHDIRNSIYRLTHSGRVERVSRGVYKVINIFFRHYLSVLAYCGGRKRQYYALTFDDNESDHETVLFNAVLESTIEMCGNQDSTGYEISETSEGMDSGNTYPQIEVGQL